jgi:DNA-binding NarL/FixJ family response regulator
MIKVAIVEDDAGIRESLAILVRGAKGFSCIGTFSSGELALQELPKGWPDVVIMDINLPQMSGVDCVMKLKELKSDLHVLMFTVDDNQEQVFKSLQAGACGYLVKDTPPAEILDAITDISQGGAPMSSHIARKVVRFFQKTAPAARPAQAAHVEGLSERENEILILLAKGYRYKEIADAFSCSVHTVRSHLRRIYEKLHVTSRTEAAMKLPRAL